MEGSDEEGACDAKSMMPPWKPPMPGRWSSTSGETGRGDPPLGSQAFCCLEAEPLAEEEAPRVRREPPEPRKGLLVSLRERKSPRRRFAGLKEDVDGPGSRLEGERWRRLTPAKPGRRPGRRGSMSFTLRLNKESRWLVQPNACMRCLPCRAGDLTRSSIMSKGKREGTQGEDEISV